VLAVMRAVESSVSVNPDYPGGYDVPLEENQAQTIAMAGQNL
jgi:hypothetical protein